LGIGGKMKNVMQKLEYALSVLNMASANDMTYDGRPIHFAAADAAADLSEAIEELKAFESEVEDLTSG
jgi:hypothetical protein